MNGVILHTPLWPAQGQIYVSIPELVPCIPQSTVLLVKYLIIVEFSCRW